MLSIAPRFWPSKPLAGLGRIWNRYLPTMLTWNRRDSTPLSAAPRRAIKDGFFGLINPYLFFQSRVCTEFLYLSLIGINLRWGFLFWELIFMYCGLYVLILVVFVLFSFSLHFGQISRLAFFRWFLTRPRIGMLSLVTVSPVITAFHNCCLSHHVFDQVNLWLAWVGFETAIFWQCSPGTVETQRLYPLHPEGQSRMDFLVL